MTVFEPQISSYRTTNCATTTARVVLVCIEAVESNLVKPDTSRTVILTLMASVLSSLSLSLSLSLITCQSRKSKNKLSSSKAATDSAFEYFSSFMTYFPFSISLSLLIFHFSLTVFYLISLLFSLSRPISFCPFI